MEANRPVGIVIDHDLVIRVLATGDGPQTVTLGTVMTPSLAWVSEDAAL